MSTALRHRTTATLALAPSRGVSARQLHRSFLTCCEKLQDICCLPEFIKEQKGADQVSVMKFTIAITEAANKE